jgi:hypothetical protein
MSLRCTNALATLALTLAAAGAAQAQGLNRARALPGFAGFGLMGGGKTLATVQYTNGDTAKVHSGGLVDFRAGLDWHTPGSPFALQASVGYFVDRNSARNGSVRFQRYPFELLGFGYVSDKLRLGGGLRATTGAKLTGNGFASGVGNTSFKTSTGLVLEGEYFPTRHVGITGRFVSEKYTAPNGVKISGDHIGTRANFYF